MCGSLRRRWRSTTSRRSSAGCRDGSVSSTGLRPCRWRHRLTRLGRRSASTQTCLIGCTGSAESRQPGNEAVRDRHRVRVTAGLFIAKADADTARG
jgi:hypothetical protein